MPRFSAIGVDVVVDWNHQKFSATVSVPNSDILMSDWSEPGVLNTVELYDVFDMPR